MLDCKLNLRDVSRSILLATSILILIGSLGCTEATAYYSLIKEPRTSVTPPPVILQNGTAAASTIYTNSTSAKVSVSGYGYDFVDSNDTDVDLSGSIGTHSNFTAQKYGPDLINDTLTEEDTGGGGTFTLELWVDGFDNSSVEWDEIGLSPYLSSINYPTDYITTDTDAKDERFSFANTSATGTINDVMICVYARQDPGDDGNIEVWIYNSTTMEKEAVLAPSDSAWTWNNFSCLTTLPTWTGINSATLRIAADKIGGADTQYVDAALLFVNYTISTSNYELDLEVRWTSVDSDETYEELCIKTGTFSGSEDIMVYAWNVSTSDWHFLYNLTTSDWNNVSVTDWLNNENFTVRFLGGTENSDTSQDSWNIDATLLHIWTETDYVYDYVLRIDNTDTNSWEVRLKKYSNSSIGRLENCTIYFRNSTNDNSTQIVIENGSFNETEGPWYYLDNSETIYIAMAVEADSTGTSYVYTYLEIRFPGTTTYAQYIITFRVT